MTIILVFFFYTDKRAHFINYYCESPRREIETLSLITRWTFVYTIIISSINRINHLWRFHFPRNSREIDSVTDILSFRDCGKSSKIQFRFSQARIFFSNIRKSSLRNWLSWRNRTLVNRINQLANIDTHQKPAEIDFVYVERLNVIAQLGWITCDLTLEILTLEDYCQIQNYYIINQSIFLSRQTNWMK